MSMSSSDCISIADDSSHDGTGLLRRDTGPEVLDGSDLSLKAVAYDDEYEEDDEGSELRSLMDAEDKKRDLFRPVAGESGLFLELSMAMYSARYLAPILAFIAIAIGYYVTIAPYHPSNFPIRASQANPIKDLGLVRPLLDAAQMHTMRKDVMNGETQLWLPNPWYDQVKLRFHPAATSAGHHRPPELFYKGVLFGLSDQNSHRLRYTEHKDKNRNLVDIRSLRQDLQEMKPYPTAVIPRQVQYNVTGWNEDGFAVYFSYADLERQGKLSSDKLKPWKRILESVLSIARHYRQVYITCWYPHEFGTHQSQKSKTGDPYKYTSLLQEVIPTRTGLHGLKSTVPVWMSALNHTAPKKEEHVYRKAWTEDDHWTMYTPKAKTEL